jgi:hypothetical protein
MKLLIIITISILFLSCGKKINFSSLNEYTHDSSYVYLLPYENGQSHLLVQGYHSLFSHRGRLALDFKMKKNTIVMAAREGVVTRVVQEFSQGGI